MKPTAVVVGAGPGGLGAALRLRDGGVKVRLLSPGGVAHYLPGTLAVALGTASAAQYAVPVALRDIEVVPAAAEALGERGVQVEGKWLAADVVVAAPGLLPQPLGQSARVKAFWGPQEAEQAAPLLGGVGKAEVAVVIAGLPYRCPPAPYGLAMMLADWARRRHLGVHVSVVTPEESPLQALGARLGQFLVSSCEAAGAQVVTGYQVDYDALGRGELVSSSGERLAADLVVVVPRHVRTPLLAGLAGPGPLVAVQADYSVGPEGPWVVGDAAATPFPRAAGPAATAGKLAAEAALVHLGLLEATSAPAAEAECFVAHSEGSYSRARVSYGGQALAGAAPEVSIEGPSEKFAQAFQEAFEQFAKLRQEADG